MHTPTCTRAVFLSVHISMCTCAAFQTPRGMSGLFRIPRGHLVWPGSFALIEITALGSSNEHDPSHLLLFMLPWERGFSRELHDQRTDCAVGMGFYNRAPKRPISFTVSEAAGFSRLHSMELGRRDGSSPKLQHHRSHVRYQGPVSLE